MARRKRQPEEPIDFTVRQRCRFPAQWADIDPAELQRRHAMAALFVAQGRAAIEWSRTHGEP